MCRSVPLSSSMAVMPRVDLAIATSLLAATGRFSISREHLVDRLELFHTPRVHEAATMALSRPPRVGLPDDLSDHACWLTAETFYRQAQIHGQRIRISLLSLSILACLIGSCECPPAHG